MGYMLLTDLAESARGMGLRAEITGTGGNVVALAVEIDGGQYLIALGDGYADGFSWGISTDGETRERLGDLDSDDFPVTGDADQTVRDAIGWVRADHGRAGQVDA